MRGPAGVLAAAAVLFGTIGVSVAADPISVVPNSGPIGTVFTVSGTGCTSSSFAFRTEQAAVGNGYQTEVSVAFKRPDESAIDVHTVTPDQTSGAWSTSFGVPADAVPGTYPIDATCYVKFTNGDRTSLQQQELSRAYARGYFTVPPLPVVEEEPDDEAQPATAERVQPTFTG